LLLRGGPLRVGGSHCVEERPGRAAEGFDVRWAVGGFCGGGRFGRWFCGGCEGGSFHHRFPC
jgi:hypothetical protein